MSAFERLLDAEIGRLREAVEDARRFAAHVEAQNAAALGLHRPGPPEFPYCSECVGSAWPCATALALGAEAGDD